MPKKTLGDPIWTLVVFKLYEKSGHSPMNHEATEYANDIIEFVNRYR